MGKCGSHRADKIAICRSDGEARLLYHRPLETQLAANDDSAGVRGLTDKDDEASLGTYKCVFAKNVCCPSS
jgi:hypothetical protein